MDIVSTSRNHLFDIFLLDESFGSDSSSIKIQPKEYGPLGKNLGFNTIVVIAYDVDKSSSKYEEYDNVAELESGATCNHSSSLPGKECQRAIDWNLSESWNAICTGGVSCTDQYITINFIRPIIPYLVTVAKKFGHFYIKDLEVHWSSGHIQLERLQAILYTQSIYHSNEISIETGFKLTIKSSYSGDNLGFRNIFVFSKRNTEHVYSIQEISPVIYYIPGEYQNNFRTLKFKVYAQGKSNQTENCSSIIIGFKDNNAKQFQIHMNVIEDNENYLMFTIFKPTERIEKFHLKSSLVKCNKWSEFWLEIFSEKVCFGSGKGYGIDTLAEMAQKYSHLVNNNAFLANTTQLSTDRMIPA
ncbi:DgyrCDS14577 [Dimorphilus gyrociliatus]|uniref:DgyrCDS14577 n=1 Tax=Dimorphilus gyrociliatus TaxID=2664684 RepID=A0A7I8WE15_9ANNE|nr:DgyrCDS14577 [Dimorphilus gyrociliatus]